MRKIGANVLLISQCPGICSTPSQGDMLLSEYNPAFSPAIYNNFFYLGRDQSNIRIKSEFGTVKHVEAFQSLFTDSSKAVHLLLIFFFLNLYFMFVF